MWTDKGMCEESILVAECQTPRVGYDKGERLVGMTSSRCVTDNGNRWGCRNLWKG